jgi:sarcosine oxidase, subunit alpha
VFEPVGQWRRAYTYPQASEDRHQAINREILCVRNKVGLLDASTLGKIEIKGPDAAEFLDRMYTNTFSTLKIGKCRYGLMMNELGFLTDDGVTVRLGEDHFLMHTTSGGADRISAWLEEWLQTEWTHYKVFVTPVTEQWAQFAVAGPHARDVLAKLDPDFDISNDAFPHMSFKEGKAAGYPVRISPARCLMKSQHLRIQVKVCGMRSWKRATSLASALMAPKHCTCCALKKVTSSLVMKAMAR